MGASVPESTVKDSHSNSATVVPVPPAAWRSTHSGALMRLLEKISLSAKMGRYRFSSYIFSHLWFLKLVFLLLRRARPVAIFGNLVILTKMSDVREVLGRFDDFTLGEVIEPGMPWGPFLMTVDWKEQHKRERELLQSVVKRDIDPEIIRKVVAETCRKRIAAANGRIDMVTELAEPVLVRVAAEYFGVLPLKGDERSMARATRNLAGIIMVNPPVGSQPWIDSREDIIGLTQQLLKQIADTRSLIVFSRQEELGDNLLTRLMALLQGKKNPNWFDEDWIRRYLTGLVATGLATVVRGTAHTIDQLVAHPEALAQAQRLAVALDHAEAQELRLGNDATENDRRSATADTKQLRDQLEHYIYEALRFRPMLPLLVRDAPRETIVANGTKRARVVPAGARILAGPLAAMFDSEAFPQPDRFDPRRPIGNYIHFGDGERHCFGKYVAENALIEMVRALLRLPDLDRASGKEGNVRYQGPAPCSFVLTFSQGSVEAQNR